MCIFVIKFKFSFFQNKLFDSTQLIVINLINSSSENLMDYIHNASVKKKVRFSPLNSRQIATFANWLTRKEKRRKAILDDAIHVFVFLYYIGKVAISRQPFRIVAVF